MIYYTYNDYTIKGDNMNTTAENLDHLTYQMTDEEISLLSYEIFSKNKQKYNISLSDDMTDEEFNLLTSYLDVLPLSQNVINSMDKLGLYTKEELEEENRKRYAERKWEQYI